jgi:AsmA protein
VPAATGIKRLGLAVAALLVAGIGLLLALSLVISADTVREAVKSQIRSVTGLDPVLRGDVAVSLFPTGSVRFNDISLGDNRTGAPALTAEQLRVRLRFFPFLLGRIEIADVTLVRPTIMIAFDSDGRSNWGSHIDTLARALEPSPSRVSSFSEIRIGDGTVILRDEGYDFVETLTNVEFALAWPSISKSFAATGRFVWHDKPIDGTLSLTDFVAALNGKRSGLKVRLSGTPLKLAFDGYVSSRPSLRMEGTLVADSTSLRDTLHWISDKTAEGAGLKRFAIKAQTNVVGRNISLSKVNIDLDGNVGEGVLTFTHNGRQALQGTLAVEDLDLTPYASAYRLFTGDRDWNRVPIDFDGLNNLDVDLRLSAARVTIDNVKLGRTAIAANLSRGTLNVAIGESQAFGGVIKGSLALADAARGAEMRARLQFSDVLLDRALDVLLGVRRVAGRGNIGITVDGTGRSVYELAKGLNGTIALTSRKGAIAGVNIEQLLKRLERNPLAARGDFRGGKTPYDLLTVNLKLTKGVAHVEDMRLEAPGLRLGLAGSASISERDLDLTGTASLLTGPDSKISPAFDLPFVVQGRWDDPLVWPDVQLLIRRSGAAAPLLEAVRKRLKREQTRQAAPQPSAPAQPASIPSEKPALTGR